MKPAAERAGTRNSSPRFSLDRKVLIGTLIMVLCLFIATWIGSRGFLPGAKLFPDVLAAVGIAVTLVALLRVWRAIEPGESPGQAAREDADSAEVYRKAFGYLCGTAIYFLAIFLIGFLPATALLLVVVPRIFALSYRYAIASAVAGLVAVYVLSTTLGLYLPLGWIVEQFFGG